jgi:hypothetical protein
MDKKKFEKILDQYAEDWYIDSDSPVKWGGKGPRQRVNRYGEKLEANATGSVQVAKWFPIISQCSVCEKHVADSTQEINLWKGTVKCSCKKKFGVCDLKFPDNLTSNKE